MADKIIIDAQNTVAGRVATVIAKELLKGKEVIVVNAEKAVISGDPVHIFNLYKQKIDRGDPYHGPFYPRRPEMILKRMTRGMLPKSPRGREAYSRLKVFISVPEGLSGDSKRPDTAKNDLKCKYTPLGELSVKFGVRKTW